MANAHLPKLSFIHIYLLWCLLQAYENTSIGTLNLSVDFDWWFMIIQLIYLSCDIPSNRRNDLHHNFPMVVLTVPTILVRSQYCSFQRSPPKQYTAVSNNNREWLLASLPQLGKIVGKLRSICNVSDQTCENEKYREIGI